MKKTLVRQRRTETNLSATLTEIWQLFSREPLPATISAYVQMFSSISSNTQYYILADYNRAFDEYLVGRITFQEIMKIQKEHIATMEMLATQASLIAAEVLRYNLVQQTRQQMFQCEIQTTLRYEQRRQQRELFRVTYLAQHN